MSINSVFFSSRSRASGLHSSYLSMIFGSKESSYIIIMKQRIMWANGLRFLVMINDESFHKATVNILQMWTSRLYIELVHPVN
jgi:hypothetical protein